MKRFLVLTLAFAIGLTLTLMMGCSDDDAAVNPDQTTPEPQDSAFLNEFIGDEMLSRAFQSIPLSLELLKASPSATSKAVPTALESLGDDDEEIIIESILSYTYTDGWHIFDFEATVVDLVSLDTVDVAGTDSVQILENGTPVREPVDSNAIDGLRARAHIDWDLRGESNQGNLNHRIDVILDPGLIDTIVTIDGSVHDTIDIAGTDDDGRCEVFAALDQATPN